MNIDNRFSIIRWTATALPIWLALTDYFNLQAYLLRLHDSSSSGISAGWNLWYLTLIAGVLLAGSNNFLIYRFKQIFGTPLALKACGVFLILFPNLIFYTRYSNSITEQSSGKFLYLHLFIILFITLILHLSLFFFGNWSKPKSLI